MYKATEKVLDRTKSIFNRFVAEYEEYGVKVALEAPTLMGLRMADSVGDHSQYHIVNADDLPELKTTFPVIKYKGAFIDVLESNQLPSNVHVVYADYCGTPLITKKPIRKNPPREAKFIHDMLRSTGVALFTFCQRGCRNAKSVCQNMLARHFDILYVHSYGVMLVYICVKKTASQKTRKRVVNLFTEIHGLYLRRSKDTVSPAEKALVMQHRGNPMSRECRDFPEECEVCLNWFNQHTFFVNKQDNCICQNCWDELFEHEYSLSVNGTIQWTHAPSAPVAVEIHRDFYGTDLHFGDGIVYIGSRESANYGDIGHVESSDSTYVRVRFQKSVIPCIPAQTVKLSDGFVTAITKKRTQEFPYWLTKATKVECMDALKLCMVAGLPVEVTKPVFERIYEPSSSPTNEPPAKRRRIAPMPVSDDDSTGHESDDDDDDSTGHESDDDDDSTGHESDDDKKSSVAPSKGSFEKLNSIEQTRIRAKNAPKSVEMWYRKYCESINWKTEKLDGAERDAVNKHYANYIESGEYAWDAGIPQPDDPTELKAPERTSKSNNVSLTTELARLCGQKPKSVQEEDKKYSRRWAFKMLENREICWKVGDWVQVTAPFLESTHVGWITHLKQGVPWGHIFGCTSNAFDLYAMYGSENVEPVTELQQQKLKDLENRGVVWR